MSKVGHHRFHDPEREPVPCFHCGTEPRLEGHVACTNCHNEARCPRCHPELNYTAPADLTRGHLSAEAEEGSRSDVRHVLGS